MNTNLPAQVARAVAYVNEPPRNTKAIHIRRAMLAIPAVEDALTKTERMIFNASTKRQICEMSENELVQTLKPVLKMVAMDVGLKITKGVEWQYAQTRAVDILAKYFEQMTVADVKQAFEMLVTGGLDEWLPRDAQGQPDRKHYGQFNAEYLAKVLRAYGKVQAAVIGKAYDAARSVAAPPTDAPNPSIIRDAVAKVLEVYRQTKRIDFSGTHPRIVYGWLQQNGYADAVQVQAEDRSAALAEYLKDAANGLKNQYEAQHVRRLGEKSAELDFGAFEAARIRAIKAGLQKMIAEGIEI